jgi:LuxR family maltose regulon positive regulatory protein
VEIALGRYEEANALMQKATDLAQQFDATDVDDFVVACRIIQLRLLMGDDTQMDDLENHLPNPTPPNSWKNDSFLLTIALTQEIQELTQAWVLLHKDKYSQAIPMLTDLLDQALSKHLEDYAIQFAVLLAIAYHKNWNREKALEYIGIAMRMAKKEDQVQVFLEQGVEILDLLYDAADRGIEADFAGRILALSPQMEIIDRNDNLIHYKEEIIEPLSRREMDILKEISKGLSNQEIAYALNLSLSTIKVHTYNIFRKLNVRNRTQAVTKARLINILP